MFNILKCVFKLIHIVHLFTRWRSYLIAVENNDLCLDIMGVRIKRPNTK